MDIIIPEISLINKKYDIQTLRYALPFDLCKLLRDVTNTNGKNYLIAGGFLHDIYISKKTPIDIDIFVFNEQSFIDLLKFFNDYFSECIFKLYPALVEIHSQNTKYPIQLINCIGHTENFIADFDMDYSRIYSDGQNIYTFPSFDSCIKDKTIKRIICKGHGKPSQNRVIKAQEKGYMFQRSFAKSIGQYFNCEYCSDYNSLSCKHLIYRDDIYWSSPCFIRPQVYKKLHTTDLASALILETTSINDIIINFEKTKKNIMISGAGYAESQTRNTNRENMNIDNFFQFEIQKLTGKYYKFNTLTTFYHNHFTTTHYNDNLQEIVTTDNYELLKIKINYDIHHSKMIIHNQHDVLFALENFPKTGFIENKHCFQYAILLQKINECSLASKFLKLFGIQNETTKDANDIAKKLWPLIEIKDEELNKSSKNEQQQKRMTELETAITTL